MEAGTAVGTLLLEGEGKDRQSDVVAAAVCKTADEAHFVPNGRADPAKEISRWFIECVTWLRVAMYDQLQEER